MQLRDRLSRLSMTVARTSLRPEALAPGSISGSFGRSLAPGGRRPVRGDRRRTRSRLYRPPRGRPYGDRQDPFRRPPPVPFAGRRNHPNDGGGCRAAPVRSTAMSHPISLAVSDELTRTRLTVAFRLILAIPAALLASLWGIAAALALIVSWFATLVRGQTPERLHNLIAGYMRGRCPAGSATCWRGSCASARRPTPTRTCSPIATRASRPTPRADGAPAAGARPLLPPYERGPETGRPADPGRRLGYLIPITMESGPTRCSARVSENPASSIQPMQSAAV